MGFFCRRRARLRPEYASLYPRVVAGIWLGARRVAGIVRRSDPTAGARERAAERLLPETHFEFRGGRSAPDRRQVDYSRAADDVTLRPGQVEDAMRGAQESPIWPEGTPAYQPAAL